MPGPTGLLSFEARYPDRFFDVGIAEQHEATAAAGMAMGGLRPVVAVYSTFFCRAFDQANLDVGLHGLPGGLRLDRAGITGDDGPSHRGLGPGLALSIPGMTVFVPSSAEDLEAMLHVLSGSRAFGYPVPQDPAPPRRPRRGRRGARRRRVRVGDGSVCLVGVGKLLAACEDAAAELAAGGIDATVLDPRVISPADPAWSPRLVRATVVVTAEDGVRFGGAGVFLADAAAAAARRAGAPAPATVRLGTPRAYIPQGKADDILAALGLDGPGIATTVRRALGPLAPPPIPRPTAPRPTRPARPPTATGRRQRGERAGRPAPVGRRGGPLA